MAEFANGGHYVHRKYTLDDTHEHVALKGPSPPSYSPIELVPSTSAPPASYMHGFSGLYPTPVHPFDPRMGQSTPIAMPIGSHGVYTYSPVSPIAPGQPQYQVPSLRSRPLPPIPMNAPPYQTQEQTAVIPPPFVVPVIPVPPSPPHSLLSEISIQPWRPPNPTENSTGVSANTPDEGALAASESEARQIRSGLHRVPGSGGRPFDLVLHRGKDDSPPMYGKNDRIDGHLDITNAHNISKIEVFLEGNLDRTFSQQGLPFDQQTLSLLSLSKVLYDGNAGLVLQYPFSFEIPPSITRMTSALPPTFHSHHPGAAATITYQVRAVVTKKQMMIGVKKELVAKLLYYPRAPIFVSLSAVRPERLRDIELAYNLPPINASGNLLALQVLKTTFSIPSPAAYIAGRPIEFTVTFSCPDVPSIPALLTPTVTLLRTTTIFLHGHRSVKEIAVNRGQVRKRDFRPDEVGGVGGTRVFSGTIMIGQDGDPEGTWAVDKAVDVRYALRLTVAPDQEFQTQFVHFTSIPTFEHREDITIATDTVFNTQEESKLPNLPVWRRRFNPQSPGLHRTVTNMSAESQFGGPLQHSPTRNSVQSFGSWNSRTLGRQPSVNM